MRRLEVIRNWVVLGRAVTRWAVPTLQMNFVFETAKWDYYVLRVFSRG